MKAIMNKEIVEVNIKAQLEQLIGEYHASQQSLADGVRALNQKYKEDVQQTPTRRNISARSTRKTRPLCWPQLLRKQRC